MCQVEVEAVQAEPVDVVFEDLQGRQTGNMRMQTEQWLRCSGFTRGKSSFEYSLRQRHVHTRMQHRNSYPKDLAKHSATQKSKGNTLRFFENPRALMPG